MVGAQEEVDPEDDADEIVIEDPSLPYEAKYEAVLAALPLNTNKAFQNVLEDNDGPNCLLWVLKLTLNKAVAEEGMSYDTTSTKSALASKVVHSLFSVSYILRYKLYDPRENYVQEPGTCMEENIYTWVKDAMNNITAEFYGNFNMENKFKWVEFFAWFRKVWRWTRSNNSEGRRRRRRRKN